MTIDNDFERGARAAIARFLDPKKAPRKAARTESTPGLIVRLAVRQRGMVGNEVFVYASKSISRLQAQIEAERAAREAGYPVIAYVIDYTSGKDL